MPPTLRWTVTCAAPRTAPATWPVTGKSTSQEIPMRTMSSSQERLASPSCSSGSPSTQESINTGDGPLHPLLMAHAQEISCGAGTVLFQKGQSADSVYVLLSGEVRLQTKTLRGTTVVMGLHRKGQILGTGSLTTGRYRLDGLCTKPSRLLTLPLEQWRKTIDSEPEVRWSWIASGQGSSDACLLKTYRLTLWRVEDRLRHLVLAEGLDDQTLPWTGTQTALAEELGLTRFALCRVLGRLVDDGRLEMGEGWIRWTGG